MCNSTQKYLFTLVFHGKDGTILQVDPVCIGTDRDFEVNFDESDHNRNIFLAPCQTLAWTRVGLRRHTINGGLLERSWSEVTRLERSDMLDFADDGDVESKVRNILKGAKSKAEVEDRLRSRVIRPAPSKLYSVQGRGDGFDVLFLIGVGERPRVVHCIEADFDDLA